MNNLAEIVSPVSKLLLLLIAGAVFAAIILRSIREEPVTMPTPTKAAVPPIDADAPTELETATFALG
jgi:hypothetical protein